MNTIKHLQRLNFQTKPENKIDFHLHQCRLFTDIVFESKNEKFFLHKCQLFAFASIVKFLNIICTKINEAEYLVKDDYSTNFKKAIQTIYSNTITLEQKLKILNETFHLHLLILQEDLDLEARFEFQMNDYTDCLIVTGGVNQYISVNKFYLSQYPFFRILFTSNFGDSTTNKFNFTNEFKDDELNLKNLFLNFTFKGEINPTLLSNTKVKTLIQFYKLGNFLGSDEICYFINWYFYNIFCLCSHCIRNSLKILKFLHHNTLIDSRQNNFFDLKNIYMKILTKKIRLSAILENKTFISEISSYKGSFFSLELKNKKDGEKNFVALLYIIERQDKELRIDIGSLLFDLIFFELNSLTPGNIIKRYIAISRVKCENKGWQASIQFVLRGEMEFLIVNNFEFIYSSALDFKLQLLDHGFE
ncbi:hypothetical protein HK099_000721 [Clydaea vesicula]|uniref:BTB domain-containing protein n=1 Tax=Clydaea vesicula TaxID=447962 RepID=A0AAD5XZY4_9FUNG|nr:hypothetical protein HK099_000721 [Clydaea vesicula]